MIDRRLIQNFDWLILFFMVLLEVCGLIVLYSACYHQIQTDPIHNPFVKQLLWFAIGLLAFCCSLVVDYRKLKQGSMILYISGLILLAVVFLLGREANGAKRWLILFGIRFQPSEVMKIIIVIYLAAHLSSKGKKIFSSSRELIRLILIISLPVIMILAEPDLGTALTIIIVAVTMIYFVGLNLKHLIISCLVIGPMIWPIWHYMLKPYQKTRILVLIQPDKDPLGAGYHIRQSKISIGSGMLMGKGFLHGTQNKLHFLPEKHTDFIFSVLGEEWGFVGSTFIIGLFFIFILLLLQVAYRSKDYFGTLLVVGMTALITWQVIINVGMVVGILPVVGIPLPFFSYGGSAMVTLCFAIGLVENVSMRRYIF